MKTREYIKQYTYYYLYLIAIVLVLTVGVNHAVTQVSLIQQQRTRPVIVIDAGHGGMDGGTTSCTGVLESTVNLEIALRLDDLMHLLGYDTILTRSEDVSLSTEGDTIRRQKASDLKNRAELVNRQENAILLSIHQNHFTQSQYSGPQVFYASGEDSRLLADQLQTQLNGILAPQSSRTSKKADSVYLMEHIDTTGILIECGFLSNPAEEAKLQQPDYQKKLCGIIAAVTAQYIQTAAIS